MKKNEKKVQKEKKLELSITKNNFNLIPIKNKLKYSSVNYDILCDKNFNNFHWFLLKNKKDGNDDINNFIWAEKNSLENLDTFNSYRTEVEEENKKIIQNISKLEEKDDIISKLTYKIKQLEKQNNTSEDIKNTSSNMVPLDKFNKLLIQLNELEEKFNILQKENLTLKNNKKSKKKKEKKNDNNNSNDINMKDYINKSIKINNFIKNQKENNNLIMNNEDLKNIENILDKNLNSNSKEDNNNNDDSMNINYDQSSLENSENNNNKKENEDKIDENEDESNEESGEISDNENDNDNDNENGDDNNEDDNELRKELNQTKYQLDYIRNLYRDIEKKLSNIKKAIKKLFKEIKIPEKENDIKNILKLCEFKDDEILEIIDSK